MDPIQTLDDYLIVLIFSHLDAESLWKNCACVCKEWNMKFFYPSSKFYNTVLNISYLGVVSQFTNFRYQYHELFGLDNIFYSRFDELKGLFTNKKKSNSPLNFGPLLKSTGVKKSGAKKLLTVSKINQLLPIPRDVKECMKLMGQTMKIFPENNYLSFEKNKLSLAMYFEIKNSPNKVIACTCSNFLFVFATAPDRFNLYQVNSKKYHEPNPIIILSKKSPTIVQMELRYHPFMQQELRNKLNQTESDTFIYSLYVLFVEDRDSFSIRRYFIIDNHNRESLQVIEDIFFVREIPILHPKGTSMSVGDWDVCNIDIILITTEKSIIICCEEGPICTFSIPDKSVVPFDSIDNFSSKGVTASVLNFSKPLMREGVVLADPEKYSNFAVVEINFCYLRKYLWGSLFEVPGIAIDKFHVIIAKKHDHIKEENRYSITWRTWQDQFKNHYELAETGIIFDDTTDEPIFIEQGRRICVKRNFKLDPSFYSFDLENKKNNAAISCWTHSFDNYLNSQRFM